MLGQLFGVRIYYFGSIYLYALCVVILSTYYFQKSSLLTLFLLNKILIQYQQLVLTSYPSVD